MEEHCPFCQIVAGELDSYSIHETSDTLAFLDVNPVSRGHSLVIPKSHAEHLKAMEEQEVASLFRSVSAVASAVEEGLEPDGVNILQSNGEAAGQEIGHVHVHIIPRYSSDGFSFSFESGELASGDADDILASVQDAL